MFIIADGVSVAFRFIYLFWLTRDFTAQYDNDVRTVHFNVLEFVNYFEFG